MSTFNKNWPRWIKASILQHIKTFNDAGPDYHIYVEGEPRKTNQEHHWIEVRLDGPIPARERAANQWRLVFELNIAVMCGLSKDLYQIDTMVGEVCEFFTNSIAALKLGNGPGDDETSIGCLTLDTSEEKRGVTVNTFGQVEAKTPLLQSSVEARYWIDLEGE